MKIKEALFMAELAAGMMAAPLNYEGQQRGRRERQKDPLNKSQKKVRAKNKQAKQSRKRNRK